tara:strand:+ start:245 stop:544 length:300 start_codon:yes stop_codon:yes gene_type:complete
MRYITPVIEWGKKVGPKMWSRTKETPGKVRQYTTDTFSKLHQSKQWKAASKAINEMGSTTLREYGGKLTTKTGIGISAGVAGGTVGYMAGKKKKRNRYG